MVGNITSLTGNGLRDWFIQRLTAVAVGFYGTFLLVYVMLNPHMSFNEWQELFSMTWMQIAGTIVILSIVLHAWIGLWTVSTDYLKCSILRTSFISALLLAELVLLIWGIKIVWGI